MQTIDPDSPLIVAKSTLILGGLGSLTGLTIGAIRAQNPILLGMNMGLNGTVGGLTFFAVREYVVSPLLLVLVPWESYRLRREALAVGNTASDSGSGLGSDSDLEGTTGRQGKTMSLIRNDRLLDSGLAGGLTGGGISTMFRGKKTFPAAFVTSALITTSIQYAINNVRVTRLKMLAARQEAPMASSSNPPPAVSNPSIAPGIEEQNTKLPLTTKLSNLLHSLSPIRKITNEEYLDILLKQRSELTNDLTAWEERMRARYGPQGTVSDQQGGKGAINVEQLVRQLDGVERKINEVEGKIDRERVA